MAEKATPNQCKYLWSFQLRFGSCKNDWFKSGISKTWAMDAISLCKAFEKDQANVDLKLEIQRKLNEYHKEFTFKDGSSGGGTKPEAPVPTSAQDIVVDPNMDNESMFTLLTSLSKDLGDLVRNRFDELATKPVPEVKPISGDYYKPAIFDEAALCLRIKKNLLVFGPAGCGKSRMGAELAKVFNLPFFAFSFSGGQAYAQIFGSTHLENGKSFWKPGELLNAVQKPGITLLDEIFAADPSILLGLNALLQDRVFQSPIGPIYVHEDHRFIAAANTNGRSISRQYTGAQRADDSLSDRFVKTKMDYDPKVEDMLLSQCARQNSKGYLRTCLSHLRQECRTANIAFDPSTRRLISAIELANAGLDDKRAFEMAFLEDLSSSERAKVQL